MDNLANLQAMQTLLQQFQLPPTTMPAPAPVMNQGALNPMDINSLTALLLYSNHLQQQPPAPVSMAASLFQPRPAVPAPAPNFSAEQLTNQLIHQNTLNQLNQLLAMNIPQPAPPTTFPPQLHPHLQPQHLMSVPPAYQQVAAPMPPKPHAVLPSRPITIPSKPQMVHSKQSLPTSFGSMGTPEFGRKRRHRDVEMLSQPPSQSGSPVNDKFARTRASTCPNTMKSHTPLLKGKKNLIKESPNYIDFQKKFRARLPRLIRS